ncbi:hypothetical protein AB5I41_15415 [Sphingomonas sp. MMS24-JH45]
MTGGSQARSIATMLLLALALQAAPAPERFSILVADQPCTHRAEGDDIPGDRLVAADALPAQALPLPNEASPRGRCR